MPKPTPDHPRTRKALWLANLTVVMLIAGIILFLPRIMQVNDLPDTQTPILIFALLSLPVAFLAPRLTGIGGPRLPQGQAPDRTPEQAQKETTRFAIAGTLAELPAMFGLIYALVGGTTLYGLLFAAAALAATMALRPE